MIREQKKIAHQMSEISTYSNLQVLAYDPTRTTTLRTAFVRDVRRRYKALTKVIKEAVVDQDCFGLSVQTNAELVPPNYRAFDHMNNGEKVNAFVEWMQRQENKGILAALVFPFVGSLSNSPWTDPYILQAYKQGVTRARTELIRQGYGVPSIEAAGGIDVVLQGISHVDRLSVLQTKVFQELTQTTAAMDSQIMRVLSQGLLDGSDVRMLARKLVATINGTGLGDLGITDTLGRFIPAMRRAETIARTEIIRAHHLANIEEYKTWQVSGVTVIAEWSTAGDDRVCAECASLHGNRFTLKEIEHMIPRHPNCRCIAIPITTIKK